MNDMKFPKILENCSATYIFTDAEKASAKAGDTLLFSFVVKSPVSTPIDITVDVGTSINYRNGSKTMTYYVPAEWTRIYMPIKNSGMNSVTLKTNETVYVAEAKYENKGDTSLSELQRESGMWLLSEYESRDISALGIGAGPAIDLVRYGKYLYGIGAGKLSVIDTETNETVSTLSGFGVLRQIDVTDDGKYVVISARQDGVYVVSVEDPKNPAIVSTYNSVEMATGLYVSGNYAFVCNRQYGVEVVDISDKRSPKHLINIRSGEVQSCVVHNNLLYAGVWGECGVFLYDLSDITDSSRVEPIAKIYTNGKGDGLSVTEIGGKTYMFAATGHHTYGAPILSPLDNLCYGQGNGLDIFDVTDPKSPRWISSAKIDGRFYFTSNDYWETEVGYDEKSGRYYAYLVNTYNGLYVFDVTNIEAPKRVAHYYIKKPLTEEVPALRHSSRAIITPWDQTKENRGPVGAAVIDNGRCYIAGSDTDIFAVDSDIFLRAPEVLRKNANFSSLLSTFYSFNNALIGGQISSLSDGSYHLYNASGQILGAAVYGDLLYLAQGAGGVKILDTNTLNEIGTVAPVSVKGRVGFANDVKVYGARLYVAADIAGLRVYDISGDFASSPKFLWDHRSPSTVRQVIISPDGLFSVLALDSNGVSIVKNSDGKVYQTLHAYGGNMYHHNISTVIDDRYICFFNHVSDEYWLDFGPPSARYDDPVFVATGTAVRGKFTGGLGMTGGVTEFRLNGINYALKIQDSKAVYTNDYTKKCGTVISGVTGWGKPTVCGSYLFVSERIGGTVKIYDIGDLSCVKIIGTLTFDGNPDIIISDGTKVYIPLGYQGLLEIDTSSAFIKN